MEAPVDGLLVLYKAMIMYTFLGTAKMLYNKQSRSKYSAMGHK